MTDYLGMAYPKVATRLRKLPIAALPTPVSEEVVVLPSGERQILVKHDEASNEHYGGNKIRKLEYLLQRALERGAKRVATFGAVGSNHALATAVHATRNGLGCTCFLAHQKATPYIPKTLRRHLTLGTELLRFGGSVDQLALFRRYIQHRDTWVIPVGGSCWLGALGFVNAAFELAAQIESGEISRPDRIYIANGTMGSTAGLTIGFALLNLPIEVHAVRVVSLDFGHPAVLQRMILKTLHLLRQIDPSIPEGIADSCRVVWRDEFYAGGYAVADDATRHAVELAADSMRLCIETTYTGKAMAALIADLDSFSGSSLFWNTYGPPRAADGEAPDWRQLPADFHRYFANVV